MLWPLKELSLWFVIYFSLQNLTIQGFLGEQPDAAASNGSSLIIPRNESLAEEMELEDSRERRKFSGEEDTVEERGGLTTTESKEEEEEDTTTRTSKKWKKSKKESDEDQNGEITIDTTTVGSTEEENSRQGRKTRGDMANLKIARFLGLKI